MTIQPAPLPRELGAADERLDQIIEAFREHRDGVSQDAFFEALRAIDVLQRAAVQRLYALLTERSLHGAGRSLRRATSPPP